MRTSLFSELLHRDQLFIGGGWATSSGHRRLEVENPATEQFIGAAPAGTEADVDAAVEAAALAFDTWAASTVNQRRQVLRALAGSLADRREELAAVVTSETGIPIAHSRQMQADLPVTVLDSMIDALEGLDAAAQVGNARLFQEPAGVVAAITAWNRPISQAVAKVGAAIAAGCTVVLKPSEETPLSAYLLADSAQAAGVPHGVLNVVTGGREVGAYLASHPLVDMVSFTGSPTVGRRVLTAAARSLRRVSLELGGNSANVLLDDADLACAVRRGVQHVTENGGHTCTAGIHLVVPRHRQSEVVDMVRDQFETIVVGDPWDDATTMGPLGTRAQKTQYQQAVAQARTAGAKLAAHRRGVPAQGHYVEPIAFCDVDDTMINAQHEVRGPMVMVLPFDTEEAALRIANDSGYGMSGAVWSADPERALRFARRMNTGQVSVNDGSSNPHAPCGGYEQSSIGRAPGRHGIDAFTQLKAVHL